jgi:MFS family permease
MSATVLILVGAVLCFAGALSVRIGVLAAGGGAAWLLADAFGANLVVTLVVAAAGAVAVWVATLLISKFLVFLGGACVGAVVGAKVFVLADSRPSEGGRDWLLALVFVAAVALLCGFLAGHYERAFLTWGTALAGAALLLSGIGRIDTDLTDGMWRPRNDGDAVVFTVAWILLTLLGHRVQRDVLRRRKGRKDVGQPA